ncbi:hypothetical protein QYF61_017577 [Mycteria americana]|uniref:PHF7/G2E3-like PHD zinc finger domain-containing protein n=1 Tax=Mycteria americana TaxID=33587 RepID=A0AAN7NNQ6_MYCAM|nr:hypothetical protein QYF61_017577 [Mycteria americana]
MAQGRWKLRSQPISQQFFANKLCQQRVKEVGLMGFLPEDMQHTIEWAAQKRLQHRSVIHQADLRGLTQQQPHPAPTVGLAVEALRLPLIGAAVLFPALLCLWREQGTCSGSSWRPVTGRARARSFSWEHHPEQAVEVAPEENTTCLICLDFVGDRKSYSVMVCPACKHAWFHRGGCIQNQAMHAGFSCFWCPNSHKTGCKYCAVPGPVPAGLALHCPMSLGFSFTEELKTGQGEKSRDTRGTHLLPQALATAPVLLPRCSCAAEGTHRCCSYSRNSTASWECNSCAGRGTGRRQSTRVALDWGQGPGKAWQWVPRLGLAEPLCSRRAGATALAYPAPGLGGRDLDLPASPYSLHSPAPVPPARQHRGSLSDLWHWRPASPALLARHHQGPPVAPQHFRAAPAPAPLGLTGYEAAHGCNARPQILTACLEDATGPALHQPQVLALIPSSQHNKVGC